jgi:hypothetical protein
MQNPFLVIVHVPPKAPGALTANSRYCIKILHQLSATWKTRTRHRTSAGIKTMTCRALTLLCRFDLALCTGEQNRSDERECKWETKFELKELIIY